MSDASIQSKEYLSSKDAGKLLGYTHDYISKLCREGKMSGKQKGRAWFVTADEVQAFKTRHAEELQQKKVQLSHKFSKIRSAHESKRNKTQSHKEIIVEERIVHKDIIEVKKTHIPFVFPKQFAAAFILIGALVIPSLLAGISQDMDSPYTTAAVLNVSKNGTETLALAGAELFKGTYSLCETISYTYLALYVFQGQMIFDSILQLDTMGATVLQGYELVGASVYVGGRYTIESYKSILNIDSNSNILKKN